MRYHRTKRFCLSCRRPLAEDTVFFCRRCREADPRLDPLDPLARSDRPRAEASDRAERDQVDIVNLKGT